MLLAADPDVTLSYKQLQHGFEIGFTRMFTNMSLVTRCSQLLVSFLFVRQTTVPGATPFEPPALGAKIGYPNDPLNPD